MHEYCHMISVIFFFWGGEGHRCCIFIFSYSWLYKSKQISNMIISFVNIFYIFLSSFILCSFIWDTTNSHILKILFCSKCIRMCVCLLSFKNPFTEPHRFIFRTSEYHTYTIIHSFCIFNLATYFNEFFYSIYVHPFWKYNLNFVKIYAKKKVTLQCFF